MENNDFMVEEEDQEEGLWEAPDEKKLGWLLAGMDEDITVKQYFVFPNAQRMHGKGDMPQLNLARNPCRIN